MLLTIFTPTYNRAKTITRTYQSIKDQSCKDFEWIIVDDGSTDNTEVLVSSWLQQELDFPIRYIKQSNGGKYRAYNNGLRNAKGELFFCVDSDDWLPKDSVKQIKGHYDELISDKLLAGLIALKENSDKILIGKAFYGDIKRSSLYNLELLGQRGERSIVFKLDVAQQFPFPEETGEKFVPESVVYDRYEGRYQFLISNDILTTCEYQDEGLSSNPYALMLRNPAGYKLFYAQRIDLTSSIMNRIIYAIKYNVFKRLYNGDIYSYSGVHEFIVKIVSPFSIFLEIYYKIR